MAERRRERLQRGRQLLGVDVSDRAPHVLQRRSDVVRRSGVAQRNLDVWRPPARTRWMQREVLVAEQGGDLDGRARVPAQMHPAMAEPEGHLHVRALEPDAGHLADDDATDHDAVAAAQPGRAGERGRVAGAGVERQPVEVERQQEQHDHQAQEDHADRHRLHLPERLDPGPPHPRAPCGTPTGLTWQRCAELTWNGVSVPLGRMKLTAHT